MESERIKVSLKSPSMDQKDSVPTPSVIFLPLHLNQVLKEIA